MDIDRKDYEAQLHTSFVVHWMSGVAEQTMEMVLDEVTDKSNDKCSGFSLVFTSEDKRCLQQSTYPFEHAELGRRNLFMVPIGRTSKGCEYEVIINRIK